MADSVSKLREKMKKTGCNCRIKVKKGNKLEIKAKDFLNKGNISKIFDSLENAEEWLNKDVEEFLLSLKNNLKIKKKNHYCQIILPDGKEFCGNHFEVIGLLKKEETEFFHQLFEKEDY